MADWENPLGQESPLSRALRLAMPEDLRNPLLHPQSVNHFALPPQQPRAELRNLPPRPGDYLSPVSEAISPTMGAYGLGNALGDAYVKGREGDYKGMASPLAEILLSMAPVPGMKKGAMPPRELPMDTASRMQRAADLGYTVDAYHGTNAKPFNELDRIAYFSSNPNVASDFARKAVPVDVVSQLPARDATLWDRLKGLFSGNPPMEEYKFKSVKPQVDGGHVIPAKINPEGFKEIDWPSYWKENGYEGSEAQRHGLPVNAWDWSAAAIVEEAEMAGLPGVVFRNVLESGRPHTEYAVIDPTRARSRFAAFDPAQKGSANLLASGAAVSPIVAAALQAALMGDKDSQ